MNIAHHFQMLYTIDRSPLSGDFYRLPSEFSSPPDFTDTLDYYTPKVSRLPEDHTTQRITTIPHVSETDAFLPVRIPRDILRFPDLQRYKSRRRLVRRLRVSISTALPAASKPTPLESDKLKFISQARHLQRTQGAQAAQRRHNVPCARLECYASGNWSRRACGSAASSG